MICNKKEWQTLDAVGGVLLSVYKQLNQKQVDAVNEFIKLCEIATQQERERRRKTAAYIANKRKTNKNYARSKKQ